MNSSSTKCGPQDEWKRRAALHATDEVKDGMVLGLGTGTTIAFVLDALATRIAAGLNVVGIPTSRHTEARAKDLAIPLTTFERHRHIDLTLDGADEVEQDTLNLIKGAGGALLHEKIVASASKQVVIIVDETKVVKRLGNHMSVPVEIVSFGWQSVFDRLAAAGMSPLLRMSDDQAFLTDGGNYIVDCALKNIVDPANLEKKLKSMVGVIETGLFIGLTSRVIVGGSGGVITL